MSTIEQKLNELIADEASYHLIELILNLMLNRTEMNPRINYSQSSLVLNSEIASYEKLNSLALRFDGLCEVISNAVIANDLMGHSDFLFQSRLASNKDRLLSLKKPIADPSLQLIYNVLLEHANNPYEKLSLKYMDRFSKTHSLDVGSYFEFMNAYFSDVYPFQLFSMQDKVQVGREVDQSVLGSKLEALEEGRYIKFMTLSKTWAGFSGHTMVIKKTGGTYSFFDPNHGETLGLNLKQLCVRINACMDFDKLKRYDQMAFIDGNQFIEHVQDGIPPETKTEHQVTATEPASLTDVRQSSLILSEIQKIIRLGLCRDEDLISWIDHIKQRIHSDASSLAIEPSSHDKTQYNQHEKMGWIDFMRIRIKRGFWSTFRLKQVDSVGLNEMDLPFELLNSPYDVAVLFETLSIKHCQDVCEYRAVELSGAIKTPRDIRVLFDYLSEESDGSIKLEMIYNVIKPKIPRMIQSAHDINTAISMLSLNQRMAFFDEEMLSRLPSMIESLNDVADVFHALPADEQRIELFDKIKDRFTEIAHRRENSAYIFRKALTSLLPTQRIVLFDAMKDRLHWLYLEDMDVYDSLLQLLDTERAAFFREAMQTKRVDAAIASITSCFQFEKQIKSFPEEEDRARIFEATEKKLEGYLSIHYSHLPIVLRCLSPEQYEKFTSNERVQQSLNNTLRSFELPADVAESFSAALLSNNDQRIKMEFDRFTQHETHYFGALLDCFRTEKTEHPQAKLLASIARIDPYWQKKINKALKLDLADDDFRYTIVHKRLCEYCDNRSAKSSAFFEMKSILNCFKQTEEAETKSKTATPKHD